MKMDPHQMTSSQMKLMNTSEIKLWGGRKYMQNQTIKHLMKSQNFYSTQSDMLSLLLLAKIARIMLIIDFYDIITNAHTLFHDSISITMSHWISRKSLFDNNKLCPVNLQSEILSCDMMKRDARMTEKSEREKSDVVDGDKEGFYRIKNWKRKTRRQQWEQRERQQQQNHTNTHNDDSNKKESNEWASERTR